MTTYTNGYYNAFNNDEGNVKGWWTYKEIEC